MNKKLSLVILRQKIKALLAQGVYILLAVILVCVLIAEIYIIRSSYVAKQDLDVRADEVSLRLMQIQNNTTLTDPQIDSYNSKLKILIPSDEDYFSIIRTLEQLAAKTGFAISRYSIDPGSLQGDSSRFTITVEGTGNQDTFLNILQDYQYGGGRFVTNSSATFSSDAEVPSRIVFNFYRTPAGTPKITTLSELDMQMLREIDEAVVLPSGTTDQNKVVDYEKSDKIF